MNQRIANLLQTVRGLVMTFTQHYLPTLQHPDQGATAHHEELVRAAKAGSHAAFAELQIIYSRRLYNRIFSITRNREDAEDALQDTFLRAYRALPSFEGRSRFSSWLMRIAINSALMIIRRRRARPETSLEEQQTFVGGNCFDIRDAALNPEEIYDQQQRSHAILQSIHRLDMKLRIPLDIWMSEEYSIKDLAQHLGISVAAAKARLHRARKHLAETHTFRNRKLKVSPRDRDALNVETPQSRQIRLRTSETLRSPRERYYRFSESQLPRSESLCV